MEVWDLLQLLGLPEEWNQSANFLHYFEQVSRENPSETEFEFLAQMFRRTEHQYGATSADEIHQLLPKGTNLFAAKTVLKALREDKSKLRRKRLNVGEKKIALQIMQRVTPLRYLMARQTRNLLREYYKKGKLNAPIALRNPKDIPVALSPEERSLYEAVEDYISKTYNKADISKRSAVGFVMTIYRRRLASSFQALQKTLTGRLDRLPLFAEEDFLPDETGDSDTTDAQEADQLMNEAAEAEETNEIKSLLKRISQLPTDSKALCLLRELQSAFSDCYDSAIVFTQYTDTIHYLKTFLADRLSEKRIACYEGEGGLRRGSDGTWAKCRKEEIKRDLKAKKIDLLICTDAAGEGLNLQFCGVLVNYDLPWNPMKVEQRIGRIDRIGQVHPYIRILNLAYEDTVEADVYFKVGQRINLFQGIIGKLQPILSRLPKKFEEYTLGAAETRDEARHRLQSDLEDLEREAREPGFDIDASATENIETPNLPISPLTLEDIDQAVQSKGLLPNALQWRPLDWCSYGALLPGMENEIRVTTSGNVFSDCSDSQVLFSPAGELFGQVADAITANTDDRSKHGICWLAKQNSQLQFLLSTRNGIHAISSWNELARLLDEASEPKQLGDEFETVQRII